MSISFTKQNNKTFFSSCLNLIKLYPNTNYGGFYFFTYFETNRLFFVSALFSYFLSSIILLLFVVVLIT